MVFAEKRGGGDWRKRRSPPLGKVSAEKNEIVKDTDRMKWMGAEDRRNWVKMSRELWALERTIADLQVNVDVTVPEFEPVARVRGALRAGFPVVLTADRGRCGHGGRCGLGFGTPRPCVSV